MYSFLQAPLDKLYYNSDGTMEPKYREHLLQKGWSLAEINNLEQIRIRDAAIDKEVAEWQEELKRKQAELNAQQEEQRRQEAERMGIPYKPLTAFNNFTRQTRAEQMAGLDREELLSQGFLEPDDFYDESDD